MLNPDEIYSQFQIMMDSPHNVDFSKMHQLFEIQVNPSLRKDMVIKLIEANWLSWEDLIKFFDSFLKKGDTIIIETLLHFAELGFDKGGYKFILRAFSANDPEILKNAQQKIKRSVISDNIKKDIINYLEENVSNRKLIEFILKEQKNEYKELWYSLLRKPKTPLDMKLKIMDSLKENADISFSRILEKLCEDPEPVIASSAQRILDNIFGKYTLKRNTIKSKKNNGEKKDISIRENIRIDKLIYFGIGFFIFLALHLFLYTSMPSHITYFGYWVFIILGSMIGAYEGAIITLIICFTCILSYIFDFSPNFVPSITLLLSYFGVGLSLSYLNNKQQKNIERLIHLKTDKKRLTNRISILEKQLDSNLEIIQGIKEKLTERTVKLYALMINIREITSSINIDKIMQGIVDILVQGLGVKSGQIFIIDKENGEAYTIRNFSVAGTNITEHGEIRRKLKEMPLLNYIISHKEMITLDDLKRNPELLNIRKKSSLPAKILAPLMVDNEVKAIINISEREKNDLVDDEMLLINAIISSSTIALKNAEIFNLNHEELKRVRKLSDFERKRQSKVKELFQKYVSQNVVDQLLESNEGIVLGGQNREIAILLLDIRGFTTFSEQNSPEVVVELLNTFFKIVSGIILDFRGTIDKFMGDAVLAFFGAPVSFDKAYINAIDCGFKILSEAVVLNDMFKRKYNFDFKIGMTVNFGKAVVGNIGSEKRMEYTAIGDCVNTTARLEDIAGGGQLLVPESLFRLIQNDVVSEKIGEFKLKGKREPVGVYNLRSWKKNI